MPQAVPEAPPDETETEPRPAPAPLPAPGPQPQRKDDPFNPTWPDDRPEPEPKALAGDVLIGA